MENTGSEHLRESDWRKVMLVLRIFKTSNGHIGLIVALGLISSLIEGLSLYLFLPILAYFPGQEASDKSLPALLKWVETLLPEGYIFAGLLSVAVLGIFLKNLVSYINESFFAYVNCLAGHKLRSRLYRQILQANATHINQSKSGQIANAMISETWRSVEALGALYRILVNGSAVLVLIGVLAFISWQATLLVVVAGTLFALVARRLTRLTKKTSAMAVSANTEFIGRFWETMEGLPTIRQFGQMSSEVARFDVISHKVEKIFLRLQMLHNLISPSFEVLVAFFVATLFVLMGYFGISIAGMVVFFVLLFRITRSFRVLLSEAGKFMQLAHAVAEVDVVGRECEASALSSGTKVYDRLKDGIRLRKVSHQYPDRSDKSLSDVDLFIPAGACVAFVGPSGAGKSTIVQLLCRDFDPMEGSIEVDGTNLREFDTESWRHGVSIVPQKTHLFDATVAENIAFGRKSAGMDLVRDVAHRARCDDFIERLPNGYDTQIGKEGVRLSGGQRQRLSFARALLVKPSVLILDEATNELDHVTEEDIMNTVRKEKQDMTVIMVAHRLSSVRWCDLVFVLEAGRVVRSGPPSEVLG